MAIMDSFKEQLYRPLHGENTDSDSPSSTWLIEPRACQKSHLRLIAPWIASTVSLALILGYVLLQQQQRLDSWSMSLASTLPAFRTDLQDAHSYIALEERVFSGALLFNKEIGKVYWDVDPSQPQYFGLPKPEIDHAWHDLLRGEFVRLTEEEAAPYAPELNKDPLSNYYHFEPDMFHSLHCLNAVRMEIDKDYYSKLPSHHAKLMEEIKNSPHFPQDYDRIHLDHCLDQIRQSIQCQGDLSPAPLYHYNNDTVGVGRGQVHTCRKWEPMREWMDVRMASQRQKVNS